MSDAQDRAPGTWYDWLVQFGAFAVAIRFATALAGARGGFRGWKALFWTLPLAASGSS